MILIKQNSNAFQKFFEESTTQFASNLGKDVQTNQTTIPANIYESGTAFQIELNAPGRNKEDFKITIDKSLLTISVEPKASINKQDNIKTIRAEFTQNSFKRSFSLEDKVNTDAINASYENGILHIYLPKKEEIKVTKKEISVL